MSAEQSNTTSPHTSEEGNVFSQSGAGIILLSMIYLGINQAGTDSKIFLLPAGNFSLCFDLRLRQKAV